MKRLISMIAAAAMALSPLALAVPADASVSQGFISGVDLVGDDWGDEGELSQASYANSSAVGVWQRVLWADGYLGIEQIDCRFGTATYNATRAWQAARGLTSDGRVGPRTFGLADNNLRPEGTDSVYYAGSRHRGYFFRQNGRYYLFAGEVAYYRSMSQYC